MDRAKFRPISGLRRKKCGRETEFDRSGYFSLVEELSSAKALRNTEGVWAIKKQ